jgi:protocatechuate 3,4-dioxygenase beta subunit
MNTKHTPGERDLARREALKRLGALAIALPTLTTLACSAESEETDTTPGAAGAEPANKPDAGGGHTASDAGHNGAARGDAGSQSPRPSAADAGTAASTDSTDASAAPDASASSPDAAVTDSGKPSDPTATAPRFDDAASCTLTTTDIEGPFYVDEGEVSTDASMIRSDIRDGHPGVEFTLSFRFLDAKAKCAPLANVQAYIWHCDADGYYSGFSGQDPEKPYAGSANPAPSNNERFCRGIQVSDQTGVVTFTTIYPGWYAGRPLHIHLLAYINGTTRKLITTQLYFPAAFSKQVHQAEPAYKARAANIPAASLNPPSGKPAMPTMTHVPGLVTGTLNVIAAGV